MDGLWWLPSLIVFGAAGIGVWLVVRGLRRDRARNTALTERSSSLALVAADEAVRRAEEELAFADAQFGAEETATFRTAVDTARESLRESFRLRQLLDDDIPDSPAQRSEWTRRIILACDEIEAELQERTADVAERRTEESSAPQRLAALGTELAALRAEVPVARQTIRTLGARFAPSAWDSVQGTLERSESLITSAESVLSRLAPEAERGAPILDGLEALSTDLVQARSGIASIQETARTLDVSAARLDALDAEVRARLDVARQARDAADPDAADLIDGAIRAVDAALARAKANAERPDPLASIDDIRSAEDDLDSRLSAARSAAQRLDNAREALGGAIFSAVSHIDVASRIITGDRGRVGAEARTRLSEAQRQLALARAAEDPVEALDTARRAARIAQEASDLAHYDLGPMPAPVRRD